MSSVYYNKNKKSVATATKHWRVRKIYKEYVKVLSGSIIFQNIVPEDIVSMLHCIKPKKQIYKKNEFIALAGERFKNLGIIFKGEAIVTKENLAGNRLVMTVLEPGNIFGEMAVFSAHPFWPSNVQAQEECEVLFLGKEKILGQCEKACPWHKTLIQNMLKIISERALMLNKKVEYLTIKSMRGKISTYLLEQSKKAGSTTFMLPLKRNELAEFLNVSRPSMSRELCRMRDEGLIDFHLSSFKIKNIEALKDILN